MLNWLFDRLPIGWFFKLALVRLTSQWRSILTIVVGVLLSALIGASVPLYTTAISQVGLAQRLEQSPTQDVSIHSRISLTPADLDDFSSTRTQLDEVAFTHVDSVFNEFGDWVDQSVRWAESSTLLPVQDGVDIEGVRFRVGAYDDIDEYIEIIDGQFPDDILDDGIDLEIAIHERVAQELNLRVGDEFILDQRGWDTSRLISTRVTGIIRERTPHDLYWFVPSPLRIDSNAPWRIDTNLLTTQSSLERIVAEYIPQTRTQLGWRIVFDHQALPFSQIQDAITQTSGFEAQLTEVLETASGDSLTVVYETNIPRVLSEYSSEVDQLGIPFTLLLLQLGALVIFFLLVMASLVRRGERREVSMLQSRGARDRHILLLRAFEAIIICIVAIAIAPVIARQILVFVMPLFTDVDKLPLKLTTASYIYAGVASIVAFVILMATLIPVMRQPLISAGGSHTRSLHQAWWQRYYLDVVLLLIGSVALWQTVNNNSLLANADSQNAQADPILLIAPTLLILAFGSIALRIFPNVMDIASRWFSRNRNLSPTLASWQISREPLHYGRITFLLALSISIGWFAISFQSIVSSSQIDQTNYQVGADVQLNYGANSTLNSFLIDDEMRTLEGVEATTAVLRLEEQDIAPAAGQLLNGTILAVDAQTFSDVAFWRDDLGTFTIPEWNDVIPMIGSHLPIVPQHIGFWVLLQANTIDFFTGEPLSEGQAVAYSLFQLINETTISIRLEDDIGNIYHIDAEIPQDQLNRISAMTYDPNFTGGNTELTNFDALTVADNWVYMQTDTSSLLEQEVGSVTFIGLSVDTNSGGFSSRPYHLYFRDMVLFDTEGEAMDFDIFNREGWESINETSTSPEVFPEVVDELPGEIETSGLHFSWRGSSSSERTQFGLIFNYPEIISTDNTVSAGSFTSEDLINPMPVIVSRSFIEQTGLTEGQLLRVFIDWTTFWTEIIAVTDYYPTLYGDESPFLILNQDILLYTLHRRTGAVVYPNEIWLDLGPTIDTNAILPLIESTQSAETIQHIATAQSALEGRSANLLTLGLIGLLYIAFGVALLLSLVSMITYAGLSVEARRTEFAVLRALGFTTRRMVFSVTIEQIFVMFTAIVLGMLIAVFLSTQILPTLSVNTTGEQATPPFLIQFNAILLVQYSVLIATILMLELILSAYLIRRSATVHALRQV